MRGWAGNNAGAIPGVTHVPTFEKVGLTDMMLAEAEKSHQGCMPKVDGVFNFA